MNSARDTSAEPSWGRRMLGIEGLRGLAALSVVAFHVEREVWTGQTGNGGLATAIDVGRHGLTLFFVLSGFLLFRPFVAASVSARAAPTAVAFYRNRALRILPAYLVALLVADTLALAWPPGLSVDATAGTAGHLPLPDLLACLGLVQSLVPGYFSTGLGVAWSLTTEVTFYLILPLLGGLAALAVRRTRRLVAATVAPLALITVAWAGRVWIHVVLDRPSVMNDNLLWGHSWVAVAGHSILVWGDLFGYGMLAAVAVTAAARHGGLPRGVRPVAWAGIVALAALGRGPLEGGPRDAFVGIACAALLVVILVPRRDRERTALASVLETPPARYLGLVSYSVYLWHIPLLWLLQRNGLWVTGASGTAFVADLALIMAVTLPVAALSYHVVELPALRRKVRTDVRSMSPAPARTPLEPDLHRL